MSAFPTPERALGLTINIGLAKPGGIDSVFGDDPRLRILLRQRVQCIEIN
jgi:hypothetical protein